MRKLSHLLLALLCIGAAMNTQAKTVLISGFDPFLGGTGNNSTIIAQKLQKRFEGSEISIVFCPLRTVYFKASEDLKSCIAAQEIKPDFVISLGEAFCRDVKFESRSVNWMKNTGTDNDGFGYPNGELIDPSSPKYLPMTIDLASIKKKMSRKEKKYILLSDNAGTFVCNNTSYIMSRDSDIPYAFIHVPAHSCRRQSLLIGRSVQILEKTVKYLFD
jgi:pyroglutamyl-peptidase